MNCEQILAMISDYVDGDIAPGFCAQLQKHVGGCGQCHVVVDNIRKTIRLYKEGQVYELPLQFQRRLHQTLREKWKQTQAGKGADGKSADSRAQ